MKDGSYTCTVFCLDFRGVSGIVDLTVALKGENGLVVTTAMLTTKIWTIFFEGCTAMQVTYRSAVVSFFLDARSNIKKTTYEFPSFGFSFYCIQIQKQTQWALTSYQAKAPFLREAAAGSAGHIHSTANEQDPTLSQELLQSFEHGKLQALSYKATATWKWKSLLIKVRASARRLEYYKMHRHISSYAQEKILPTGHRSKKLAVFY